MPEQIHICECSCGLVRFEASATPACNLVCYCPDCQTAAKTLMDEMGCENPLDSDEGTPFSIFWKKIGKMLRVRNICNNINWKKTLQRRVILRPVVKRRFF